MAKTKIEWATEVWNPTTGCTKVSAGCKHCYAEKMHARLTAMGQPKYAEPFSVVRTHESALEIPLHWKKPRRIFVNSMSDLFHKDVPFEFIDHIFAVMMICRQHEFLILTKRAGRMMEYANDVRGKSDRYHDINHAAQNILGSPGYGAVIPTQRDGMVPGGWPPRNVRIGVSIEDQETADKRLPALCELAAAGWKTMVSAEPLLGTVVLPDEYLALGKSTWCIAGGESGAEARPPHPDWFRSLRDQCSESGIPFFFKQWGEWAPTVMKAGRDLGGEVRSGKTIIMHAPGNPGGCFRRGDEWMSYVGKKAAGAMLDGREHREIPE